MERKASEILSAARKIYDEHPGHCAWTAIGIAEIHAGYHEISLCSIHGKLLCRAVGIEERMHAIWKWHDSSSRADVRLGFDKAIANAEKWEREHGLWPEWTLENTRAWLDMQYKQLPREVV